MAAKHTHYAIEQRASDRPVFIYGLVDPETQELRYVGKTVKDPRQRLNQHVGDARRGASQYYTGHWIRSVLARGARPEIFVVEVVEPGGDWGEAEAYWIAQMRAYGCRLTNSAAGGQGTTGYRFTESQRKLVSESHKGQERAPETVERFRRAIEAKRDAGWTKPPNSPEARKRAADTRRANYEAGLHKRRRKATDEERARISAARRAADSPEVRAKISASKIGRKLGPMSEEHRTKISEARKRMFAERQAAEAAALA